MAKKPRIACVSNATILAAVRGYFRYDHEWQAAQMLEKIYSDYIRAKESTLQLVTLWVRG